MKKWKTEINLSNFWNKDENGNEWNHKTAHKIGKLIANELRKKLSNFKEDSSFEDIIIGFESINTFEDWEKLCDNDKVPFWESYPPIEELDSFMNELYDFADSNNIWIKTNF